MIVLAIDFLSPNEALDESLTRTFEPLVVGTLASNIKGSHNSPIVNNKPSMWIKSFIEWSSTSSSGQEFCHIRPIPLLFTLEELLNYPNI